jgi:hypothetical protein
MTHGFKKKRDRMPRAELKRAEELRKLFYRGKEATP